jgi:hypothetical protein
LRYTSGTVDVVATFGGVVEVPFVTGLPLGLEVAGRVAEEVADCARICVEKERKKSASMRNERRDCIFADFSNGVDSERRATTQGKILWGLRPC